MLLVLCKSLWTVLVVWIDLFLFLQLSFSLIGLKFNACIGGRKFWIQTLTRDIGRNRFRYVSDSFHFCECKKSLKVIVFFFCRRMRQSLSLLKNTGLRNGLLYHSLCQVELGSNVERGSYLIHNEQIILEAAMCVCLWYVMQVVQPFESLYQQGGLDPRRRVSSLECSCNLWKQMGWNC